MTRATMADVAKSAGVSKQTVSRVVNGQPGVSPATHDLVTAAIERLGYRPNLVAKQLASSDSVTVGIVATDSGLYGPKEMAEGAEYTARERGYLPVRAELGDGDDVESSLQQFLAQRLDAVILLDVDDKALARAQGVLASPHIITAPAGSTPDEFWQHDRTAVREATEFLVSLGHERIAHIGGPQSWPSARQRENGWRDALEEARLPAITVARSPWSARGGRKATESLLARSEFTALITASDDIALGAMSALADAGYNVPDDVSVIGFDGTPNSAYFNPPLTTIDCNFRALGARYVDALSAELGHDSHKPSGKLTNLLVRQSVSVNLAAQRSQHQGF